MRSTHDALLKLIEECQEVGKEVCKIMFYGPDSRWPDGQAPTNLENLTAELGDLLAAVKIIVDETTLGLTDEAIQEAFKNKMKKYDNDSKQP